MTIYNNSDINSITKRLCEMAYHYAIADVYLYKYAALSWECVQLIADSPKVKKFTTESHTALLAFTWDNCFSAARFLDRTRSAIHSTLSLK